MSRLHCLFNNCTCSKHVGHPENLCGHCTHAACWHKLDLTQFHSVRASARVPMYYRYMSTLPEVPALPSDDEFCPTVIGLPV